MLPELHEKTRLWVKIPYHFPTNSFRELSRLQHTLRERGETNMLVFRWRERVCILTWSGWVFDENLPGNEQSLSGFLRCTAGNAHCCVCACLKTSRSLFPPLKLLQTYNTHSPTSYKSPKILQWGRRQGMRTRWWKSCWIKLILLLICYPSCSSQH